MKNHYKIAASLSCLLLSGTVFSAIPNGYQPKTSLGPYVHITRADLINSWLDYALTVEGIAENQRFAGAVGYQSDKYQRFKVYGEYLRQNIGYSYFSGDSFQWANHAAIDARYQYNFLDTFLVPSVDIAGYLSSAPSKALRGTAGAFSNQGVPSTFSTERRLAGSANSGFMAGLSLRLWKGNSIGIDGNYDNIIYDTTYVNTKNPQGLGGGVHVSQVIQDALKVGGSASWRTPYNLYTFDVSLINIRYESANWSLGVEGDYVRGKNTLPSTYNIGLTIEAMPNLCCEKTAVRTEHESLLRWTSEPAMYMPQVLAIPDEAVTTIP